MFILKITAERDAIVLLNFFQNKKLIKTTIKGTIIWPNNNDYPWTVGRWVNFTVWKYFYKWQGDDSLSFFLCQFHG